MPLDNEDFANQVSWETSEKMQVIALKEGLIYNFSKAKYRVFSRRRSSFFLIGYFVISTKKIYLGQKPFLQVFKMNFTWSDQGKFFKFDLTSPEMET